MTVLRLGEMRVPELEPPFACPTHIKRPAALLVVDHVSRSASWGQLFSESHAFVEEMARTTRTRFPPPPPWIAFPLRPAKASWNQGVEGFFISQIWNPYWASLSKEQREVLLKQNPPPGDWQDKFLPSIGQ